MKLYKVEAVVLRSRDLGGGDKLLILYSREHGKIKVVAHGAAKPSSRKRGSVQLFSHTNFLLHRGRELDSVSQCEGVEMFSFIRSDLAKIGYASHLAELVDALAPEGEPNESLFTLLLETMRLMEAADAEILARSFEINAAAFLGYRPVLEFCALCQGPLTGNILFSPVQGGVLCENCGQSEPDAMPCSRGVAETMKVFLSWPPARLRQLRVGETDRKQIKKLLYEYLKYHLEQDLKSATFLNRLHPGQSGSDV
ncbi:DNA repair protein RecO [Pelotomaculum propionicicum]|uniref:DNA repair protein RecO n=1 Tax=Pelotomaculum propionicicum TaxID=258475 RepID=A0A4Y7RRB3_9FIRM|nr:DNA repair protein RecO [Pelotomaculum propionicicum]NLI11705.1 DNA repair protein RecO [Peptococcaceae bacterium]TEB11545.1 DNA repair protein RecO [Pelotomaculum propionicicum]